ncbi:methyl-accepting chemotaxis protein [Pseudomonas abyssi]|jgi:methyl-accepting chemotaxis protein|uniref:Methyl-accepting chemotaxis protein n=2 Tax=Pseudomonas abyssi TaxID=170540 RepID=A0A2A3MG73_9PSED|nr:methyl-accepting chemotaxis protein [Pseudomonas abyssi]MAD01791.1 methyl-accepting chemotaxis protein [Pseudomonadales bacterium]PBK03826.1 methyl-accepting chemotaxis protein [Pseudomonas abyssi]|tara:strand:- start:81134 stop:82759 length:1626 start_codon:yes stop_codon:yes gene_type:complete
MSLRNLTIGLRASLFFALMTLLMVALGGFALLQMQRMHSYSDEVDKNWLPAILASNDIGLATSRVRALTLRLLTQESTADINDTLARMQEGKAALDAADGRYEALISSEQERAAYGQFVAARDRYMAQQEIVTDLVKSGRRQAAEDAVSSKLNGYADDMVAKLAELTRLNQQGASAAAGKTSDVYGDSVKMVLALAIASVIATIVLALMLTRSIVGPINQALQVARTIASGDLSQRVQAEGNDEPAELLKALAAMRDSLSDTIEGISNASSQLASASEELNAVTEDSARGLRQQNNELEQAATAVNEMTAAVEEVARNAASTSDASRETDEHSRNGQDQVRQTVSSINALTNDLTETAENVESLAAEVNSITQMLDVIRAVAEQTNLLALNAAIEAARAGEQGRGFAVVADEVRALAHRTQQSTTEIEQMIGSVQKGAGNAVQAMQGSTSMAATTLRLAQAAGEALEGVTRAVSSINERNLVIASASEEQVQVAREVDRNLVNIRDLSTQSAAGAEQTNSASQELSKLAVQLRDLVARFRL